MRWKLPSCRTAIARGATFQAFCIGQNDGVLELLYLSYSYRNVTIELESRIQHVDWQKNRPTGEWLDEAYGYEFSSDLKWLSEAL